MTFLHSSAAIFSVGLNASRCLRLKPIQLTDGLSRKKARRMAGFCLTCWEYRERNYSAFTIALKVALGRMAWVVFSLSGR